MINLIKFAKKNNQYKSPANSMISISNKVLKIFNKYQQD